MSGEFFAKPIAMSPEEQLLFSNRTSHNWLTNTNITAWTECENSMDHLGYVQFITLGCVLGVIGIIGIFANVLSFVVFSKIPQKSSTTFLIQVLAVADSFFLLFNILFWSVLGWYNALGSFCKYLQHFSVVVPYISGLMEMSRDMAVWMVAVVSADRYIAIYYPLSMNKLCRVSIASKVLICLVVYVIAFNIPIFLQYSYGELPGKGEGIPSFNYGNTFTKTFTYNLTYYSIDSTMNLLLPMVMVMVMNVRIVLVLKRARSQRAMLRAPRSSESDRGSYATIMLVLIAIIFCICSTPKVVESIYIIVEALYSDKARHDTFAFTIFSTLMQAVNSFINFFIYTLSSKKFRIILRQMTCSCWRCREIIYVCTVGKYEDESDF